MLKKCSYIYLIFSLFITSEWVYGQTRDLSKEPLFTSFAAVDTLPIADVLRLSFKRKLPADFNEKIVKYKYLQELHLKNMRLKNIPSAVWSLSNLTVLDVSHNKLKSISDSLGELHYLERLIICQNDIYELPKQISKLTNLHYINMFNTFIVDFPQEIRLLENSLKEIDMRGIRLDDAEKQHLQNYLPKTKFLFSNYCNCKL